MAEGAQKELTRAEFEAADFGGTLHPSYEDGEVRACNESKDRYIARLERTLKTYSKENRLLREDLAVVRAKCLMHFNNCQELMRVELKLAGGSYEEAKERKVVLGEVCGTGQKFTMQGGNVTAL